MKIKNVNCEDSREKETAYGYKKLKEKIWMTIQVILLIKASSVTITVDESSLEVWR